MQYTTLLTFFFALLGLSFGQHQPPHPRIHETFEATGRIHIDTPHNGTIVGFGRWGIDQPRGKGVEHFEFHSHHAHFNIHEVIRYDLGHIYRLERGHHCAVHDVKPPMPTAWLWARTAKFNGTQTIFHRKLNMWVGEDDGVQKVLGVPEHQSNHPVYLKYTNKHVGVIEIHFTSFHEHQPDDHWFDVPHQCRHQLRPVPEPVIDPEEATKFMNLTLPTDVCQKAAKCARQIGETCHCPYVYGGTTNCCSTHKGGLDCSGLVQYSYHHCGGWTGMPRTTTQMWNSLHTTCGACSPSNTAACHVGDLFFYYSGPGHVIMYIGGGLSAECPHTGANCRVLHAYTAGYVGCRRLC